MFKISVYLKESPGKGLGVFAKNPIPKGTLIWEFVEGFDIRTHESNLSKLNDVQREFVDKYFWKEGEWYYSSCDHSVFQNHSRHPNSVSLNQSQMVAARDISADEEIVVNYSEFDDDYETYVDTLIQ